METPRVTPRPLPKFYSCREEPFSTKRARKTQARCPEETIGYMTAPKTPVHRNAAAIGRLHTTQQRWPPSVLPSAHGTANKSKCHLISFKHDYSNNNSYEEHLLLNSLHYDESSHESFFEQCFEIERKLGEGSFGEVFQVRSREDGRRYAVKRAMCKFRNVKDRELKLDEVMKHETLPKHPNLVNFVRAWEERDRLYIQTELCQFSLTDLAERDHQIPENLIWKYLVDLLLAIKHLHDNDLLHMDIKPDNIFIDQRGFCKLGDFGLVFDLRKGTVDIQEGDSNYLAPELLRPDLGPVGKPADVFSLGLTILELASDLDLSTRGEGWHLLRRGVLPTQFMEHLSPALRSVIAAMLLPYARDRLTADQLLNDNAAVRSACRWRRAEHIWLTAKSSCAELFVYIWLVLLVVVTYIPTSSICAFRRYRRPTATRALNSVRETSSAERRRKVTPANCYQPIGYNQSPSPNPVQQLHTPLQAERIAKPLRFDDSFSDFENDDDECNVSCIRSSPTAVHQSLERQAAEDLVHEDTSSSSTEDDFVTASGRKMRTKRRPTTTSTPAMEHQKRRMLPVPRFSESKGVQSAVIRPNKRRLPNASLSPLSATVGAGGDAMSSPYSRRSQSVMSQPPPLRSAAMLGGAGDSPPFYVPAKNLRLIFDAHGSSSDEM